ncbi:hypothetical protein B0H13DRAFT_2341076 [Mycena leptocephala]|nr:hypothetical protein B0H13DRAFT_2341076 [Mycena leptocephala]
MVPDIQLCRLIQGYELHGQGIEYRRDLGNLIIHWDVGAACYRGSVETVHLLLQNGAEVNAAGRHFDNPLQAAWANGNREIVQLLLEHAPSGRDAPSGHLSVF